MKKILVLGTGAAQADLIKECKAQGLEVYACSYIDGDVAQLYADHFEQINIVDTDAVLEYAKRVKADYVYSAGSDVAMPTALKVSEELGLPIFCGSKTAKICNNKILLRETLGSDFEGNLQFQMISNVNDEIKLEYPFMMKPSDSQGQRGVCLVNSYEEFKANFDRTISFSREKKVIIEEYVEGYEISVNAFVKGGETVFSLPSKRIAWDEFPGGIIKKHVISNDIITNTELQARVRMLVDSAVKALRINSGPVYFQIIVNRDNYPKLIEVTPRLDGCHMWNAIKHSTGVDLLKLTVDSLTGKDISIPDYTVKPYELAFLCLPPNEVFRTSSFELLQYDYLQWYYKDGEIVKTMNGFMEKCGYLIKCK